MKLYYDPVSTTSRAVSLFLADEDIACEEEIVSLAAGDHRSAAFSALNPNQQVPVLTDGDFVLTESAAILRYVADKMHSLAYPEDPRMRARVNEVMDWFNTGFHRSFCAFLVYTHHLPELRALSAVTLADIERLGLAQSRKYLTVLDRQMLGQRPFVCGEEISIADYLGIAHVSLGELISFDFSPYPNIEAWRRRMKARDGWDTSHAAFNGFVRALKSEEAVAQ